MADGPATPEPLGGPFRRPRPWYCLSTGLRARQGRPASNPAAGEGRRRCYRCGVGGRRRCRRLRHGSNAGAHGRRHRHRRGGTHGVPACADASTHRIPVQGTRRPIVTPQRATPSRRLQPVKAGATRVPRRPRCGPTRNGSGNSRPTTILPLPCSRCPRTGAHLPRRHDQRQGGASPRRRRPLSEPPPPTKAKRETSREAAAGRRRGGREMPLDVPRRRAEKAGPRAPHTVRLASRGRFQLGRGTGSNRSRFLAGLEATATLRSAGMRQARRRTCCGRRLPTRASRALR